MIYIKKISILILSLLTITSIFIIIMPLSQKDESILVSTTNNNKYAYLTFDDGPSENTMKILNILDTYDIQATFFVVGPSYKAKNDLLLEIVNHGHTLAIHSYDHEYSKIYESKQAYIKDFYECYNWIKNTTGITPLIYRFPGGSSTTIANKDTIENIISDLYNQGFTHIDWNVDTFDSHYNNDENMIIKNAIQYINHNEKNNIFNQIILMHDNTKKVATIKALPYIIEYLLSKDYQFKTLNNKNYIIQHIKRPVK